MLVWCSINKGRGSYAYIIAYIAILSKIVIFNFYCKPNISIPYIENKVKESIIPKLNQSAESQFKWKSINSKK